MLLFRISDLHITIADLVLTGISTATNAQQLSAYPNPFTESSEIILPVSFKRTTCELILTDAAGRIALTQQTKGAGSITLVRGALEAGIYFCSIRSQGQLTGTIKLVMK